MRRTVRLLAAASSLIILWAVVPAVPASGEAPDASAPTPLGNNTQGCDIVGTQGPDELRSNDHGQVVCGLDGRDVIWGNGGNDLIRGGPGNDDIKGGAGDDDMYGGLGEDTCRQNMGRGKTGSCEWPSPILICPVRHGTVYDNFGDDRGDHLHQGNDILARRGEPVLATFNGRATRAYSASGAGYYVKLQGADGFTYGMHMLKQGRAEGRVKKGDAIGKVGSTGNAGSTNHLHFEWHPENKDAIDPFPYLNKVCENTAHAPVDGETELLVFD